MHSLDGILKLADNELNSMVSSGKFRSKDDVELTYKLIDIVKDIYCIWKYEDDGYSEDDGIYRSNRRASYENRYDDRSRDDMGRYARTPRNSFRRGYSRDSKQEYIEDLREMMDAAPDEQTRQSIQRMIQQIEM